MAVLDRVNGDHGQSRLSVVPTTLAFANAYVVKVHRHHGKTLGHRFSLAVADENMDIRGVAIVGRPVSRMLDNGWTLEVNRVATDGCPNACSLLYAASWRVGKAMGFRRILTYTLDSESGISLIAAGWRKVAGSAGGSWDRPSRPQQDKHPLQAKARWEPPDSIAVSLANPAIVEDPNEAMAPQRTLFDLLAQED